MEASDSSPDATLDSSGGSTQQVDVTRLAEYFTSAQQVTESLKSFYRQEVAQLEKRLAEEIELRNAAEYRLVFWHDKCRFLLDQTEAAMSQHKVENSEFTTPSRQNHKTSMDPKTSPIGTTAVPESHSKVLEDLSPDDLRQMLKTRESQLERIASQLDVVNHLYHRVIELQRTVANERREKESLQVQLKHIERARVYRNALRTTSVPVPLVMDLGNVSPSGVSSVILPPRDFMAKLRSDIDELCDRYRDGGISVPLPRIAADTTDSGDIPLEVVQQDSSLFGTPHGIGTLSQKLSSDFFLGDKQRASSSSSCAPEED